MSNPALDLPTHVRRRLAGALESGLLDLSSSRSVVQAVLGAAADAEEVLLALQQFRQMGLSAPASSTWIKSAESAMSRVPAPDLVWSGPEVPGLHARDTRRVYEELLGAAQSSLWVSTYAFFDGPKAFEILARRMDEIPTLKVVLLLNIQRKRGDTTPGRELVHRFAERF